MTFSDYCNRVQGTLPIGFPTKDGSGRYAFYYATPAAFGGQGNAIRRYSHKAWAWV